ncbi:MAG TPA: FGGY-family carbohydrate kinase, partial [Bacillales bacterium]|nr:FGGY-family carbohydrate kinase [Bacillales bacterium]
ESVPFIVGASDGVLANLGVAAVDPGSVACSVGTSGAVRTVVPKPVTDDKGRLFCYALTEDHWVIGGPVNNGGIAFRWLRDHIFDDLTMEGIDPYDILNERAANVHPGAGGLLFLPYLTGERAPFWNADMRSVFFGLNLNHTRNDMIRAVLEGVMFQLEMVVDVLKQSGVEPKEFRVTGGFTKSVLWPQIMADIFEKEILVPEGISSACFGAALLAMKALGRLDDFKDIKNRVALRSHYLPNPSHVRIYRAYKPLFKRLAETLQGEFSSIAVIQQKLANESPVREL